MSYSNRLCKLAVRGLLIGAVLWVGSALAQEVQNVDTPVLEGQPKTESGNDTSKEQREERGQKEKPPAEKLTPALNKIETAIRDFITQQRAAQSQGPKDNEISDLEAQKDMALWAKFMSWTSFAMVFITFGGVILIYRTLIETRKMLTEAENTTTAAIDTVKVTSDTAERQLRAYVGVIEATMDEPGSLHVSVQIKNVGKTPAYALTAWHGWETGDDVKFTDNTEGSRSGPQRDLFPGVDFRLKIPISFKNSFTKKAALGRKIPFYVWGGVHYTDAFGESRKTLFCCTLPMGDGVDLADCSLVACPEGSEST